MIAKLKRSLISVFPEMIVEMTPTKRVFVTSRNSAKREVVLPFASDEVFCQSVKGQPAIECKCMQYSVMVKSNPLQQVHRYVTVRIASLLMLYLSEL